MKPYLMGSMRARTALWGALAVWAVQSAWGAYDGTGTFTKITSRAELTDGYYVIASSNGLMAMTHTNAGTFFTSNAISPAANVLTDPSPAIVWLVQTNATYGGHTLFNEASNRYVAYAGTANAAHPVAAVNGTTGTWTFAYGAGAFDVANVATSTRLLQYNAGAPRFACYTTVQQKLALYKMESVAQTPPEFGANPGPLTATSLVAMAFSVAASGVPAPVLALASQTASSGFSFTPATGVLDYTPPPDDEGPRTFTFTASNSAGVATQVVSVAVTNVPATAPAFGANPGPVAATATVATAFTVTASGVPAPTLALESQTASAGFSFAPATGVLDYTPPPNDVGTQTFTFTASNAAGAAMQTVTVAVAEAPATIPAVSVTNIGTNSFTVNWTAVAGATDYQVQIATDTNFTAGGGGNLLANAGFETGDSTDWDKFETEYSVVSTDPQEGTYHVAISATGTRDLMQVVDIVGDGATEYEVSFWYKKPSGTGNARIWATWASGGQASGDNLTPTNYLPAAAEWTKTTYHVVPQSGVNTLNFEVRTYTGATVGWDSFFAGPAGGGAGGSLVADETVAALTFAATGLDMETNYHMRVRQTGGEWSSVVTATTAGPEASVPVFTGGAGPYGLTAGELLDFTVSAIGTPTPVLALSAASAHVDDYAFEPATGYFLYQPPLGAGGTAQTFTFTASNTEGVVTQVVTVNVAAATAPVFGSNPGPLVATTGVARSFTVGATGAPDPVLALQSSTASGGSYTFTVASGLLAYTPPTNDLGARTFTFTASNIAGVATQQVSVSVSNAPALPTIDPLPALTIETGQTSNLWVVARETDGDWITLVASNLPANATFTSVSGTGAVSNQFSFSPASNQAGQAYAVVFHASDADGAANRTLSITVASDDPWADYYATCYTNGVLKTGDDLKNALHDIIDGHNSFDYTAVENILKVIDECPTNSTMVQLLYLQHGRAKTSFGGLVGEWNREHVWADSHGIEGTRPAYTDVHHLHPTDVTVNNTRGNKDFDTVSGLSNTYSYSSTAFEPPDAGKGDVARAMFYMAVRYDGSENIGDLELTNAIPTSTASALHGKLDTLMDWHELDPVNDYEIRRNDLIYSDYQGNRNPFVDHPEWVRVVFDTNYVAAPPPPAVFTAEPNGSGQIDLAFTLNGRGDSVVIVWDEDGTFSEPSGTAPAVGQPFAGGTVLYKGGVSPQSHTGLTACQTRYYTCWSYSGTSYSEAGLADSATTLAPAAPASVWASGVGNETFTANWDAVAGVAGYRLDVCTVSGFSGAGAGWSPVFRETMGTPTAGTTPLAEHEANDGFDNDAYDMSGAGAANPADVRTSVPSAGYVDPAGNAASGAANVYFTTTGVSGAVGFGIAGIDTRGYEQLALSFGYYKESATQNMALGLDWSTDGGATWYPLAVSNALPAANAAQYTWYSVSNVALAAGALGSTNLSLRWIRQTGSVPGRIDDVLLQGYAASAEFAPGYSNRLVSGTTSLAVTGLTGGVTYYFRVAAAGGSCDSVWSPTGSATPTGTPAPPAFTSADSFGATTGVARTFTVTASGYPKPTLTLQGTTASGSRTFDAGTGVLTYAPSEADVGSKTFTFKASNDSGAVTQIVTAVVAAGVPSAPLSVWASATNATGFTAVWSASALASGYRLDVSTEPTFQILGGESVSTVLASNAATSVSLISGDWSGTALVGTNGYVQMLQASSEIVSPAFSAVGFTNLTIDFLARTYGGGGGSNVAVSISTNNGSTWAALGTVAPTDSTLRVMATLTDAAHLGHEQTRIRWQSPTATGTIGVGVKTLVVQGWGSGYAPSFVAGWSNVAVAGTSQAVSGLSELTTYYFRVRAENAAGTSVNSATASATTLAAAPEDQTITFPAIGAQIATNVLTLAATASSGLPVSFAVGSGPATISGGTTLSFTGAGTVSIVASQVGNASWNPAPNVTNSFAVSKAPAGVSLGGLAHVYDGNPKSATATTVPAGLTVDFTYDGGATPPTAVGSYAVTGTVADASYTGSASGTLVISKAPAAVTLGSLAQTYDGTAKAATATTDPAGLAVDFTYDGGATAPSNAGSYAVTGTVTDVNYSGSASGTLVVAKAGASVVLSNLGQDYDGSPKSATVTTDPADLAVVTTYAGSETAPTATGSYEVVASIVEPNYAGAATGTLSIVQALTAFQLWLGERSLDYQDARYEETADDDGDGMTTWEEYLADTDPADPASVLEMSGTYFNKTQAGDATGQMRFSFRASTNRFYQLEYCTVVTNPATVATSNLGWGVPDMVVTNKTTGAWFGVIRVLLEDPAGP